MCGIAGIWHLNEKELESEKLRRFTDALTHRGPDGSGYKLFNEVKLGLGHRRLSILDLSEAGKQPMSYPKSNLHITFNGEIYNFIEIRNELKNLGYQFATDTDTEVVLAAYKQWNFDCFNKFNGMWAVGIYNSDTKQLLLCRDRFGVKPLYYSFKPNDFVAFASETVAFRHLDNFTLSANDELISRSIDNPVYTEGTGYTIWNNIYQILPGHFTEINLNSKNIQQKRWFEIPRKNISISYNEAKEEFFRLTENAVKLRLRSDVPVATALSGGLDSSTVYAMLYHLRNKNLSSERINFNDIKGFVATFEGTLQDETDYAKSVVDFYKGEAEFIKTDFDTIIGNIESSTRLFNDITATPISVLGDVYKSMRSNNYIVSLDGHGVDEMLYGYRSLVGMAINQAIISLDTEYEADLTNTYLEMCHPEFREDERKKLIERSIQLKNLLSINTTAGKIKYAVKQKLKEFLPHKPDLFNPPSVAAVSWLKNKRFSSVKQLSDQPVDLSFYNASEKELAIDFYYRNIPYNMRDFDRAAMQHGIEIRMPFMDYNLVNFVFSLPMKYKVGNGYTKRVMRDSMQNILPEKISKRKLKIGMGAPIADWFNDSLSSYILDTVHSNRFLSNPLWDGKEIQDFVSRNCEHKKWKQKEAQQFWNILNAHIILQ